MHIHLYKMLDIVEFVLKVKIGHFTVKRHQKFRFFIFLFLYLNLSLVSTQNPMQPHLHLNLHITFLAYGYATFMQYTHWSQSEITHICRLLEAVVTL